VLVLADFVKILRIKTLAANAVHISWRIYADEIALDNILKSKHPILHLILMQSNSPIIEQQLDTPIAERTQIPENIKLRPRRMLREDDEDSGQWENNIREFKKYLESNTNTDADTGNATCEPPRMAEPLYQPPNLSKEALATNLFMQAFINHLEELATRLNKEITKSADLAKEWKLHIKALDEYIKSLSKLPWKKIIGYSACFFTIIAFLYKMGTLRIPDFFSGVINILPTPSIKNITEDLPKPQTETTLSIIMESPITPLALITGVGVLAISLTTLKALVWALRTIPK
jgi:hypothetical protein